ncbi:MAG: response regulator [Alphaproteobacteria bacterium]
MNRARSPSPHILLVEDSDVQALQIGNLFVEKGYEVERTASAEAAMDLLNLRIPDLIVADLHLPQMDGREFTRQLRLNSRTRAVPVLLMTGARESGGEQAGLESGADAYVPKTRDYRELMLRAATLLRGNRGAAMSEGTQFRQPRVLLLDSSPTFGMHFSRVLGQEGFMSHAVTAPDDAVRELAIDGAADCVVVNLVDAAFDGIEAIQRLEWLRGRRTPDAAGMTPFLLVGVGGHSGSGGEVEAAFDAGADDVVGGTADADVLRIRLRALLRRRLMEAEERRLDAERTAAHAAAEHARILVQSVVDYAICMLDPQGYVTTWNAGAERIKGYTADEIIGRHFSVFYCPGERAAGAPERALATARDAGKYEKEGWRVRKDGSRFWANVVVDAIHDADGEIAGYAKITRDITERMNAARELEETRAALFQAQKMESIGRLTGGIAHDFNNMLAGIIGALNLLERRIAAGRFGEAGKYIDAALTSADRAASLTSRLLAFGRRQSLDIRAVDVNAVVESMGILLERTMGENIAVEMHLDAAPGFASTDANQLENAILNLAINARDAMSEGGRLCIASSMLQVGPGDPLLRGGGAGGAFVSISVRDTGLGMTPDVLSKVFEPFFTTKQRGEGTGLGLSMVHGFINQCGGHIRIESEPGNGTKVELLLPAAAACEPEAAMPERDGELHGAGETVLVIEDDAQVRMMVVEALTDLGYRALVAQNGEDALSILESVERIDLVVSDMGLPGMSGTEIAAAARKSRAGLKVLFMTAYADHAANRAAITNAGTDLIMKPFTVEALGAKMRQMIEAPVLSINGRR